MKRLVTILVIIALVPQLSAGWLKIYGKKGEPPEFFEHGYGVIQTPDDGYAVIGGTGYIGHNTWLLKTDSLGDTLWTQTYAWEQESNPDCYRPQCYSIQMVPGGGYVLAGEAHGLLLLIRTDSEGDTLWARTYSGSMAYWVCTTANGGFAATGYADTPDNLYLVRTDPYGDTIWTKKYGGELRDLGQCIEQTKDGGFIISGRTESFGAYESTDVWLVKTDSLGDTLWTRTFGAENIDGGNQVIVTNDGGYAIAGIYDLTGSMVPESGDVLLIKTDSLGNLEWQKTYGIFIEMAYSLDQTSDGGYIIVGTKRGLSPTKTDLWLLKTDSLGDTMWTRTIVSPGLDDGRSVRQTADGGYIITGSTWIINEEGFDYDLWLIKTDSLGLLNIEESSSVFLPPNWDIASPVTSVGGQIILRYENYPNGFRASIYDATGRKVDSIQSSSPSGTITWPVTPVTHPLPPGVYIIREESGTKAKVVLVK